MQPNTFQFETEDLSLQRKMNDIVDWGLMLAVAAAMLLRLPSQSGDGIVALVGWTKKEDTRRIRRLVKATSHQVAGQGGLAAATEAMEDD